MFLKYHIFHIRRRVVLSSNTLKGFKPVWVHPKRDCTSWLKSSLSTHKCTASKIWERVFSIEVLAVITWSFASLQQHLRSGAPERPVLGNPKGIQGCSQRHHQLESPQGKRVCTIFHLHSWLDSLAEAPKMGNSQQLFINLLHFVQYSSSYRSAADKSSSDFRMAHPELLWAIPLETEAPVSKALCDYFHLNMPGCEEITRSILFTWKCHNLIFSRPVRSRKTVIEISAQVLKNSS